MSCIFYQILNAFIVTYSIFKTYYIAYHLIALGISVSMEE